RQDFTIDPATGMAKEIKIVDDNYTILVNRTHPLAQSYNPDDMVTVKYVVSGVGKKGETDQLRKVAAEAFEKMVEAAAEQEINIKMRTGFRSYEYQKDRLYDPEVKNKGQAEADKATARPGHSEHQTGLALDVGGESQKYALSYEFGDTKEGKWVAEHCHEFGFIIRYVDGTKKEPGKLTGYVFEPWHIRYVGVDVATEMYEQGGGKLTYEEYLGILD
ncbi:MAG: M15 family metallopeptidase, partial [Firmicutes bacterium]|nr:M15 family metallopeptidase [Bacillota bacterium]